MQILYIMEFCSASYLARPNQKMYRISISQHDAIERKPFSKRVEWRNAHSVRFMVRKNKSATSEVHPIVMSK